MRLIRKFGLAVLFVGLFGCSQGQESDTPEMPESSGSDVMDSTPTALDGAGDMLEEAVNTAETMADDAVEEAENMADELIDKAKRKGDELMDKVPLDKVGSTEGVLDGLKK